MGLEHAPDYKIVADDRDITERIRGWLLSLRITDKTGIESDTLELTLSDVAPHIQHPKTGAKITVSLGYRDALVRIGTYVVDEIEQSGPPDTLSIRARAFDYTSAMKAPRDRVWRDEHARIKLYDIVQKIAGEYGLRAAVGDGLRDASYLWEMQQAESDLHFLQRLAKHHGAAVKINPDGVALVKTGDGKTAGGDALPTVALAAADLIEWSVTMTERGAYHSVSAQYRDTEQSDTVTVTIGDGEPVYKIREIFADDRAALVAATAKSDALARGKSTLSLTMGGNPRIRAQYRVDLTGIRESVDGVWTVESVEHRLDRAGYVTRLECVPPA